MAFLTWLDKQFKRESRIQDQKQTNKQTNKQNKTAEVVSYSCEEV